MSTNAKAKKSTTKNPPKNAGKKLTYESFRKSKLTEIMYDKGVFYFLLAFLIPFFMLIAAFRNQEIHVFGFQDGKFGEYGKNQFLVVDLWHQYFPFFRVVREKLLNGGSFMYSWQNGMGTNFLSLISYYAASPLNWLAIFFDDDHVREALTYITAAKIGFCSAFFSVFLRYTFKRKDISIVFFSVMFALCSYTLGYYWNIMWFDTIALFPLVMTGVAAMCRERKWKLYTVSLALSLIANYYIGFFTCIFTMFMFASHVIIDWDGIKNALKKFGIILMSSVLAIGMSAFMTLPAYYALKLTYSANNTFPKEMKWNEKWLDIFANLISYSEPTSREGLPNIACGMLALVLLGVFLFSAGIKIREKIAYTIMLAFIIVSCNENQLNFIWHGFHVTNQLPYRFSFIFSFLLIAMAYRAYDVMMSKGIKWYQLLLLFIGPGAVLGIAYYNAAKGQETVELSTAFKSSLVITGAYLLLFIAFKVIPLKDIRIRTAATNVLVGAAVLSEVMATTNVGIKSVGSSDYASYPTYGKEFHECLDEMLEKEKPLFYRSEMTGTYSLNDSALYGYNGVSQFSSSANVSVTRLFQRLGLYGSEAGNRFYYRNSTPVVNGILGLDYIVSKAGTLNNSRQFLENYTSSGVTTMYKNKYSLGLGFLMERSILDLPDSAGVNPFEYQNDVMRLASGIDAPVFTAQPVKYVKYENVDVTKNEFGSYSYVMTGEPDTVVAEYTFDTDPDQTLYGYAANSSIDSINVFSGNGSYADANIAIKDYPVVFPMGDFDEGDTTVAKIKFNSERRSGSYTMLSYALKHDAFDRVYEALADETFMISDFSDTEIKGYVDARHDGVMYFSIPYEKGWSVYIDGKQVKTFKVLNSMLGVNMNTGFNQVTLKYTPDGFKTGLWVGIGSFILFLIWLAADYLLKRKAAKEEAARAAKKKRKLKDPAKEAAKKAEKAAKKAEEEEKAAEEEIPEAEEETAEAEKTPETEENAEGSENAETEEVPKGSENTETADDTDNAVEEESAAEDALGENTDENEEENEKPEGNDGVQGN